MCITVVELILVIVSAILHTVSAQGVPIILTDGDIQELVDAHNFFRGMVDPPASNMLPVVSR